MKLPIRRRRTGVWSRRHGGDGNMSKRSERRNKEWDKPGSWRILVALRKQNIENEFPDGLNPT